MAPEAPGRLVVLDLKFRDNTLVASGERYDPTPTATEWLSVSWHSTQAPDGYVSVGNGVAFVNVPSNYGYEEYKEAQPESLGQNKFSWIEGSVPLMV
jgi:hypothetical protein